MSITTVNITSQTNATINGSPTAITNWTYLLNMAIIDAGGVQISNTTSPIVQVTIKFTNTTTYNKKQIIIIGNKITINGENQTLNLSGELLYNGLIYINNGFTDIQINNIDIKVNSISSLNQFYTGWVCKGNMINTTVTFTNCKLHSDNSIIIDNDSSNGFNGGICGGGNIIFSIASSFSGTLQLSFINCSVNAGGDILNGVSGGGSCGIICGGGNGYSIQGTGTIVINLYFTDCNVYALNITNNNLSNGGICGGSNGAFATSQSGTVTLIFDKCVVYSINNITINNDSGGGICGGFNGMNFTGMNNNNLIVSLNFTNCNLESSGGIAINAINNGGICGGQNKMTVTFVNCILYYCTFITFEGGDISSDTYFYLLPGPPLYIIGNTNSNTMTLDELSGIQSNCLPPPQPPPCNPPPDPPNLWSRATLSCVNSNAYTSEQLAMRRKAEILKYKGNKNPLTKKQQWSRIVKGNGPLGKKVWATQNDLGSNPNVFNLPQVGNTLILCPDTEDKYFAYTANENSDNVSVYKIDPTTGVLTIIGNYPTGTFPTAVAVNPIKKLVYVANSTSDNISGYTIDSTTGALTAIAGSPFFNGAGTRPQSLRVDPNGNFLYVANYNSANVSGYKIHPSTGALSSITGSPFLAGSGPESVTVAPNGKFVYVANINSNFVSGYTIDPSTGTLTSIGGTFTCGPQSRSVTVDPTGNFVYITDSGTTPKIYGYTINPTTGSLTSMTGSPFNSDSPFSLAVVPNIKFAYVANYNNYFISGYAIDSTTGALTSIGTFSTSTTNLESVSVDPTGKFVYVTTHYSILGYVINQTTGELTTMTGSPFSNIDAIEITGIITVRISDNKTNVKCEPSSASDVPGNSVLCYDPAVPLVNYLPPQRTFLAGGTKWPQSSWQPGDNGFPRGKKGSMSMLFQ
jgi:6-phosphogluconolactonase